MRACGKPGCERPAKIRGYCTSCYQTKRQKWIKCGVWQRPVDATGTGRRIRALVALGHDQSTIAAESGLALSVVSYLALGKVKRTNVGRAEAIAKAYDTLSMIPGSSQQARNRARARGWPPPLAWDDDTIDDPNAQPDIGPHTSVKFPEKFGEMRELGFSDLVIAQRLGVKPGSLLRQLNRYGIKPDAELVTEAARIKHRQDRRQAS